MISVVCWCMWYAQVKPACNDHLFPWWFASPLSPWDEPPFLVREAG